MTLFSYYFSFWQGFALKFKMTRDAYASKSTKLNIFDKTNLPGVPDVLASVNR